MIGYTWYQMAILLAAWSFLAFVVYPWVVVRKLKRELEHGELREQIYDYLKGLLNDEEVRDFIMQGIDLAGEVAKNKVEMWFLNLKSQVSKNMAKAEEQAVIEMAGNDPLSIFLMSMLPKKYQAFAPILLGGVQKIKGGTKEESGGGGGVVVKAE